MEFRLEPSRRNIRYFIFLKDVLWLTFSAFGGPQAHVAMMFRYFVDKRKYLTEEELIELNALCQILPGPTSTQTITAVGFRLGGVPLAILTLLVWIVPAVTIMTLVAIGIHEYGQQEISLEYTRFIKPMAIGFVAFAAFKIASKVVTTKTEIVLMVLASVVSYFVRQPWVFPVVLLFGGFVTAKEYKKQHKEERNKLNFRWHHLIIFGSVLIISAILGGITHDIFIRMFENFYRNGSLIFGGGQVLIPLMYTEFVELKGYLSSEEFLTGFALVQAIPGPVFSFCAYIGGLTVRDLGVGYMILGSLVAALAIFTPGTLLIFFVIQIWDELKKIRIVKASISGINSAASGMVIGAVFLLYSALHQNQSSQGMLINIPIIIVTFLLLKFTKIPSPFIIFAGLLAGYLV